jgi:hypothetical protein
MFVLVLLLLVQLTDGFYMPSSPRTIKSGSNMMNRPELSSNLLRSLSTSTLKTYMASDDDDVSTDVKDEKSLIFGLDLTDPQDWLTVVLGGIVIYDAIDLVWYWGGGAIGKVFHLY